MVAIYQLSCKTSQEELNFEDGDRARLARAWAGKQGAKEWCEKIGWRLFSQVNEIEENEQCLDQDLYSQVLVCIVMLANFPRSCWTNPNLGLDTMGTTFVWACCQRAYLRYTSLLIEK